MKITGLDIGEYRQFKDIKFDFTYPEGHARAGQPLDKVCFIGQSGTGKTTLLNVIWVLLHTLAEATELHNGNFGTLNIESLPDNYELSNVLKKIVFFVDFGKVKRLFDYSINDSRLNDKQLLVNWIRELTQRQREDFFSTYKLGIYVKDSIAREADAFLFDQKDQPQTFSDFVKTDTQIEKDKASREGRINEAGSKKVTSLGDMQSLATWQYLLKDIERYDEASRELVMNLVQGVQSVSASKVVEELQKWIDNTPNARIELADKCLNPILNKFFLEVDTNAGNTPIALRTKQGIKLDNSYLSTGTRQLLATAIPIYKFDTTNTVILFDEPERSLFPDIQRILIKYYTSLAPEAQFFFATHSPIIASAFEPCERFILYFNEDGEVNCRNGIAPIGDDPNDILSADFGLNDLMLDEGLEAYQEYRRLGTLIRNETDDQKKNELIVKRLELGNRYNF